MFNIIVEGGFCAVHRVRLPDGTVEAPHGHDWMVRARFAREVLSDGGMVIDFGEARRGLTAVLEPLHHSDLNTLPALKGSNPTAEVIAKHIHDRLKALGLESIRQVEVTEAPGCVAVYESG